MIARLRAWRHRRIWARAREHYAKAYGYPHWKHGETEQERLDARQTQWRFASGSLDMKRSELGLKRKGRWQCNLNTPPSYRYEWGHERVALRAMCEATRVENRIRGDYDRVPCLDGDSSDDVRAD